MEETLQQVVAANNRFSFKLLASLTQQEVKGNIFFSPFSIAMCLAMVANGAANETRQAIVEVLAQETPDLDQLNQVNRDLVKRFEAIEASTECQAKPTRTPAEIREEMRLLRESKGDHLAQLADLWREIREVSRRGERQERHFQLAVANALWTRTGIELKPEIRPVCRDYYKAHIATLNFADGNAVNIINNWVKVATHNTIRQLLYSLPPDGMMVAVNAIYFKAAWVAEFSKMATRPEKFTLLNGDQVDRHMMHVSGYYNYLEDNELQMIKLPYVAPNEQTNVAMYIILPKQLDQFGDFLGRFDAPQCETLLDNTNGERLFGDLALPKFSAEFEWGLADELKELGMGVVFDPQRADFSNLCKTPPSVWLDKVQHKAFIKVDEKGTEAAAATAVIAHRGLSSSMVPQRKFRMTVDHPFIYLIRENVTGSILFMGVTMDPRSQL